MANFPIMLTFQNKTLQETVNPFCSANAN